MRIPSDKWTQTNSGNLFGVLHSTRNVHFDNEGFITLSKRPIAYFTDVASAGIGDADLGFLNAIVYFNGTYFFVTSEKVFTGTFAGTNPAEMANQPVALATGCDAVVWQSRLYVSGDGEVDFTSDGSTWNGAVAALNFITTGNPHPMAVMENFASGYLAIGNANVVKLFDTTPTNVQTLTLNANYEVTSLRYRNSNLYVGTREINGGEAKLFVWNGAGSTGVGFPCGANHIYSICEYGQSVVIITNTGQLLEFLGNGFQELAALPVYSYPDRIWGSSTSAVAAKVYNRGMVADGKLIYINLDGSLDLQEAADDGVPEQFSGVWCYDPKVGLYHKTLTNFDQKLTPVASSVDTSADTLTFNATLDVETGDPILAASVGSLTGLTNGQTYYIIVVSSTVIKLAKTRFNALEGNAVDLGGTLGSPSFRTNPLESIGEFYGDRAGAITVINPSAQNKTIWKSGIIWGGQGNGIKTINVFSKSSNVGMFTTQKIYSQNIQEVWQKLYGFFDKLDFDNEKIIVKYKNKERQSTPTPVFTGTWKATDTINATVTDAIHSVEVGDEITIVDGTGSGYSAHVVTIETGWVITLDESIGVIGETCSFVSDNFKKIKVASNESSEVFQGYFESLIDAQHSPWVQFRVELRGYEIAILFLDLISAIHK